MVYRRPTNVSDSLNNMQLLIECLEQYTHGVQTAITAGDFNYYFPKVDWNASSCAPLSDAS